MTRELEETTTDHDHAAGVRTFAAHCTDSADSIHIRLTVTRREDTALYDETPTYAVTGNPATNGTLADLLHLIACSMADHRHLAHLPD